MNSGKMPGMRRPLASAACIAGVIIMYFLGTLVSAQSEPGSVKGQKVPQMPVERESLMLAVTETGSISLSLDGLGTFAASGSSMGIIEVAKPAGATVRKAFLAAASTGLTGYMISNKDIKINGTNVAGYTKVASSIGSSNHFANVTSIVKPIVDAAPAGTVSLTITESISRLIDGVILAVIFDDPSQPSTNQVIIMFGAQDVTGDTFTVPLAFPITNASLPLNMSLGISFGYQGDIQSSLIDVNGTRLSSSAGGQDDGEPVNGALITVGGIGDSTANPPDPFSGPNNDPRQDDELYDLRPFLNFGDTTITVDSVNPSLDDNIFFAAVFSGVSTSAVTEAITLSPASATNPTGTPHTVTATLQNSNGQPIVGRGVTFEIISGPNTGLGGNATTGANGQASFTYTSAVAGTDTIVARFTNGQGQTVTSNTVTKTWVTTPCAITCPGNITRAATSGQCGAVVTYTPPPGTTACGTVVCSPASGSTFPVGTTTVTCTTSAGPTCTFTVTVNDTQAPSQITCPANITTPESPAGSGSATVNYATPTATDNCSVTVTCVPPSGSSFPVGTTTVNCTAADPSGNTTTCSFTVTVTVPGTPCTLTCPGNVTFLTAQQCPAVESATITFANPTTTGNCGTVTCTPPSGSVFPSGTTTVTCTASGSSATCSFNVTVFNTRLQDDSNPNTVLLIDTRTGEYRFCCNGMVFTGVGIVRIRGCNYLLDHAPADRRVRANWDLEILRGNASIQSGTGSVLCTIIDSNMANSTGGCP